MHTLLVRSGCGMSILQKSVRNLEIPFALGLHFINEHIFFSLHEASTLGVIFMLESMWPME
jgi:hypothetical protein